MSQQQLKEKKKQKDMNPIERAMHAILGFKWGYLLFAAMLIAAGVCFIVYPHQATKGASITVGAVAAAFSLVGVVMTLADRGRGFRFWARLTTMIFGVVTGIVVIVLSCTGHGAGVFRTLVLVLAVYMIIDGAFKMQTAILSRRYRFWLWWVLLVLVVTTIALGVFALYNGSNLDNLLGAYPTLLPVLTGIGFIIDGILNMLSIIFLYKIEQGQRDEIIRDLEDKGMIVTVVDAEPPENDKAEPQIDAKTDAIIADTETTVLPKKKTRKKKGDAETAVVPVEENKKG